MPQTIKGEGINLESAPVLDKADTNLEKSLPRPKPDVSHFRIVISPGWVGGNILANLSKLDAGQAATDALSLPLISLSRRSFKDTRVKSVEIH